MSRRTDIKNSHVFNPQGAHASPSHCVVMYMCVPSRGCHAAARAAGHLRNFEFDDDALGDREVLLCLSLRFLARSV